MFNVGDIVKGHINEALNKNESLSLKRLKICYQCPLYSSKLGGQCNNNLWLNPETEEVSIIKKDNYIRGCGCRLLAKTTLPSAKCPANKW